MFKKKYWLLFSLLLLGVFLFTSCLPSTPLTEGILKGRVMVPEGTTQGKQLTGQALPDATVNIIDPLTGDILATTTTDTNGYYRVFVLAGGPYLLEAIKDEIKIQQVTPQVEVGEEYDLGIADCTTTAVALIFQAMLEDDSYPDDPADINLADIEANPDFDDVLSIVCTIIEVGEDPAISALVQQAIEDSLHPPTPTPHPTPLSDAKAITAFSFAELNPDVVGVINEEAKTIALTVPFGSSVKVVENGVTALVPTIVHTGASVSPASGAAQDFTLPVNYTVTAEDTSTQAYLVTVTVALSSDATFSAGTLASVALAGTFTGGANIAGSSALIVTIPDASKVNTALALTKGNANSVIKYIKSASQPADDAAYISTYDLGDTWITVADGDIIWLLVTAEDGSTKLYYKVTVTVSAPLSSDATLKASSTIKGETLLGLGTPNEAIASATGGAVTITLTKAADTTNLTTFITLFDPTDAGATVKVVKYATGADPTTTFETDIAYANQAITTADFFIIKVTAADTSVLYYKVVVTATLGIGDPYQGGIVGYILQDNGDDPNDPGYVEGETHGLIIAVTFNGWSGWSNITTTLIGTTGTAIGTGQANTNAIVDQNGCDRGAAYLCDNLVEGGYSDWYLPSKDELNKLYLNRVAIGDLGSGSYWSSSEANTYDAWFQWFGGTIQDSQAFTNKAYLVGVRAIRPF